MAHTNSTPNYNLPQFLGTDKPAWLTDINNAMSDIDSAIAAAKTTADTADTAVGALSVTVGNHTSQLSTLSGAVSSQGNTLNTVTALIGNGTPTTTDQTIIGAINELHADIDKGYVEVVSDGVKTFSQLLDELYALIDFTKLRSESAIYYTIGTDVSVLHMVRKYTGNVLFSNIQYSSSGAFATNFNLAGTGSALNSIAFTNSGNAVSDSSSSVAPAGRSLRLVY